MVVDAILLTLSMLIAYVTIALALVGERALENVPLFIGIGVLVSLVTTLYLFRRQSK